MKKILTIVSGAPSGALHIALTIANDLKKDYQSEVCLRKYNKTSDSALPFIKDIFTLDYILSLRGKLKQEKPDLILVHGYSTHLWVKMAAIGLQIPIIHIEHNTEKYTWLRRNLLCLLDQYTDSYICVANGVVQHLLEQGVSVRKIELIYNGIDIERFKLAKIKQEKFTVGMTARFSKQKDQMTLIRAIEELTVNRNLPIQLVLQGEGKTKGTCEAYVEEKRLQKYITFTTGRIEELLPRLDVFVLATHYEGLPLVLCEAMAAKVPVIASDVSGVSEIVRHQQSGVLVPARNVSALAEAVEQQYTRSEQESSLVQAAYLLVCESFSLTRMCEQYRQKIAAILER